jgi:hypothetical protein
VKLFLVPEIITLVPRRFPSTFNEGPRISASFAAAAVPFFFLFSVPAISFYLMLDQEPML